MDKKSTSRNIPQQPLPVTSQGEDGAGYFGDTEGPPKRQFQRSGGHPKPLRLIQGNVALSDGRVEVTQIPSRPTSSQTLDRVSRRWQRKARDATPYLGERSQSAHLIRNTQTTPFKEVPSLSGHDDRTMMNGTSHARDSLRLGPPPSNMPRWRAGEEEAVAVEGHPKIPLDATEGPSLASSETINPQSTFRAGDNLARDPAISPTPVMKNGVQIATMASQVEIIRGLVRPSSPRMNEAEKDSGDTEKLPKVRVEGQDGKPQAWPHSGNLSTSQSAQSIGYSQKIPFEELHSPSGLSDSMSAIDTTDRTWDRTGSFPPLSISPRISVELEYYGNTDELRDAPTDARDSHSPASSSDIMISRSPIIEHDLRKDPSPQSREKIPSPFMSSMQPLGESLQWEEVEEYTEEEEAVPKPRTNVSRVDDRPASPIWIPSTQLIDHKHAFPFEEPRLTPRFDEVEREETHTSNDALSHSLQDRQTDVGSERAQVTGRFPGTDVVSRLEEICARLTTTFANKHQYKQLLSHRGPEAQALLDTFQLILRLRQLDGHVKRNVIVATRRLSSKTDLYPGLFLLTGVERSDEDPVASGSYADIYRGLFQGKNVCLKVIRVYQTSTYEEVAKRIAREAILWGQLSHPNLLPLYGLYRFRRKLSLVSPWAQNGNILDFLNQCSDMNCLLLCTDIAGGLAYLHENDIIHGDLKGVNILVDASQRAYLADFGLSAVEDPAILYWTSQSAATSTGGTVRWQAPELFIPESSEEDDEGGETRGPPNTKATDVYAFSCVCYEMFTGRVPFFEYRNSLITVKVRDGVRPKLPANLKDQYTVRGLTNDIWDLMNECWQTEPDDRPTIHDALSLFAIIQPEDHRRSAEWTAGPAMQKEGLEDATIPVTLDVLNTMISGAATHVQFTLNT